MDVKDRRIAELEQRVATLDALLQAALDKIAILEKHSGNSSKPPSSDIVKPPKDKDRRRKKRKIGGQQGHKLAYFGRMILRLSPSGKSLFILCKTSLSTLMFQVFQIAIPPP